MAVSGVALKPLEHGAVPAAQQLTIRALDDLNKRTAATMWLSQPPLTAEQMAANSPRYTHLMETDPGGAWAAWDGDELVGVALAIIREGLWGLSLLMVDPAHQGRGIGRALLGATLDYGRDCAAGIILASPDARALHSYANAGFRLHPVISSYGVPDLSRMPAVTGVRDGSIEDLELIAAADRHVRGAARDSDVPVLLALGCRLLVLDDHRGRGYVFAREGGVRLLAATTEEAASQLLWAALATAPKDARCTVEFVSSAQQWAFDIVVRSRLLMAHTVGGLLVRGEPGPLAPYLPSGAFL